MVQVAQGLGTLVDGAPGGAPAGTVVLSGALLIVTLPPDVPDRNARRVLQRLVAYADATEVAGTAPPAAHVPAARAHRLADELDSAWPAARWPWSWTGAARDAARTAAATERQVLRALDLQVGKEDGDDVLSACRAAGFSRTLLPGQARAVAHLLNARSGGNFSVPGSGKTTMTYAFYAIMRAAGAVDRMLVLAPLSAHEAWEEEAHECFTDSARPRVALRPTAWPRRADVVVQNYERAAAPAAGARARSWAAGHRVLIVFDEAHRVKKGDAGLHGRAARDLALIGTSRIVLTGTPMPNSEADLSMILDLAWPGLGERLAEGDLAPRAPNTWVRLTKGDLGLAPVDLRLERLQLDPAHRRIYDIVAAQGRSLADAGLLEERPDIAIRAGMRLLAVASNPALLDGRDTRLRWPAEVESVLDAPLRSEADLRSLLDQCRPVKLLRAAELAAEHHRRGKKLLVWTNFVGNVSELRRLLAPYGCATVTGATPAEDPDAPTDRARELARFRHDDGCTVLLATPQTLGEGVSLHRACQTQVHVDRGFNAGLYLQALDRTHRVGMPQGTHAEASVLIGEDTIDEAVESSLRDKIEAMRTVLDDSSLGPLALPDEREVTIDPIDVLPLLIAHLQR